MLHAKNLKVEYKSNPLGMDEPEPRFSYEVTGIGVYQSSYRMEVADAAGTVVWDSGAVTSGRSVQIVYEGKPLAAFTRYFWRVQITDESGKEGPWSKEPAFFETGFLGGAWSGKWITARCGSANLRGVQRMCKDFRVPKRLRRARLYATALGLYECFLDGHPVTETCFNPGWTDYYSRVQYQAFDVTNLLKKGKHRLGVLLGDGWFCGGIARNWNGGDPTYGDHAKFRAELHLQYEDGSTEIIPTDDTFRTFSHDFEGSNHIRMSDIYAGETASGMFPPDWLRLPGPDSKNLPPSREPASPCVCRTPAREVRIVWHQGAFVRRMHELKPVSITKRKDAVWIIDFGQNLTGRERLRMNHAVRGSVVTVRHGEMLNPDGSLYTENLRNALATTQYTCGGTPNEQYEPTFTFFGFRYLEISGWTGRLTASSVSAFAIYSDLPETGTFHCSDPLLNQLFQNIVWGQRGNFLDVPTDCPQRDERLGWTGDTQVFANVATYNMFSPEFYSKWIADLNLCRRASGAYPAFAPDPYYSDHATGTRDPGAAGWSDAGIVCPDVLFVKYGDTRIAELYFHNMVRWLDCQIELAGGSLLVDNACYGDWLHMDAPTPQTLISTAYLAGMSRRLASLAFLLGKKDAAHRLLHRYETVRAAYAKEFFDKQGNLTVRSQTAALMTLHWDLAPEPFVQNVVRFLVEDIRDTRKLHLSTGFLGTPLLLSVLTKIGHIDLAYDLLLQTTYPGWLYPVTLGATTMWERWNSFSETGFGDVSMNSFNHYAYGAVGEWFYETICGIQPMADSPENSAFKHFRLAPEPGNRLRHAEGVFLSAYGRIASAWERLESEFVWRFEIPCNTTAELIFPVPGNIPDIPGILRGDDGRFFAQPGQYEIRIAIPA